MTQLDLFDGRRKRRNPKPVAPESQEQEALFQWAEVSPRPELVMMYAVPNGGWRHKAVAAALQRQGVKAGVPDVCLPVARGRYHALYIELKRTRGGRASVEQEDWIGGLRAQGNAAEVCKGWEAASKLIEDYLDGRYP